MKTLLLIIALALPLFGGTVTIAWDANPPAENVTGYKIHYGTEAGTYTQTVDAGNVTQLVLTLQPGFYFAVATAYNATGLESEHSSELSFTMPLTPVGGFRVIEIQTSSNLEEWRPVAWVPAGEPPFFLRAVEKEMPK